MVRFRFLDWMRGLAAVVMIESHTFHSFTRADLRDGKPFELSQLVGGMAGPLFLFLAGMTLAFQMDSLERKEFRRGRRWLGAMRRAGYIFGIALMYRFFCFVGSLAKPDWAILAQVDILNCMGLAMAAMSPAAIFNAGRRARMAGLAALGIAAAAPLIRQVAWPGPTWLLHDYLAPSPGTGRFPFFPYAAYLAFGVVAGTAVKRTAAERIGRLIQWSLAIGLALVLGGRYFAQLPYSIYRESDFWVDSPALIFIQTGVSLLLLSGSYFWTKYCAGPGWSWMVSLGRNSLMVYWVHIMLVYGWLTVRLRQRLSILHALAATVAVIGLMVALSAAWMWWKQRRRQARPAADLSGGLPQGQIEPSR